MAKAVSQDSDGDGLIDNSGFADQTYDAWIVSGPRYHIYCCKPSRGSWITFELALALLAIVNCNLEMAYAVKLYC